jgi:glycosyltransferase involved in cell wall biosynthesis
VAEAARGLLARPNVRLLGQRPRAELPALVATFDVALVPYVRSLQTAAVFPLKLHEYLAAGRRVVATDFAPLPAGDGLTPTIATAADFPAAVLAALATPAPTPTEALAHGRRHDWDVRVAAIGAAVVAALAAKEGTHGAVA